VSATYDLTMQRQQGVISAASVCGAAELSRDAFTMQPRSAAARRKKTRPGDQAAMREMIIAEMGYVGESGNLRYARYAVRTEKFIGLAGHTGMMSVDWCRWKLSNNVFGAVQCESPMARVGVHAVEGYPRGPPLIPSPMRIFVKK
jgi:hypothetical protein